jgi:FKBP-type peptidyl-prolyl cis-trans isomerase
MIKRTFSLLMAVTLSVLFISSCNSGGGTEFKTTESGLKYKFFVLDDAKAAPEMGQIMSLKMTYGSEDSVFFNTDMSPDKTMKLPMQESAFPGDFYEMMSLMHMGDSAVFYLNADSFFTTTAGYPQAPEFAAGLEQLKFNVMLVKAQTEEELRLEMEAEALKMQEGEADIILDYITENNYDVEPTESGLYVVVTEKGNGAKPKTGDKVKVHYTGKLLDGTVFDSSVERGQPFEFPIGQGRVIKGWDEGIAMLNVGSKATLVIPSSIGYGERGAGRDIPPFATLVFDVELIDIVK